MPYKDQQKRLDYAKYYRALNRDKLRNDKAVYYRSNIVKIKRHLKKYRRKNRKRLNDEQKARYRKNKISVQLSVKRRLYGLSSEVYLQMLAEQDGCCAICLEKSSALHVDHNHVTKINRQLLCSHCNFLLGHAKESVSRLQAAISYLIKHGAANDKKNSQIEQMGRSQQILYSGEERVSIRYNHTFCGGQTCPNQLGGKSGTGNGNRGGRGTLSNRVGHSEDEYHSMEDRADRQDRQDQSEPEGIDKSERDWIAGPQSD